jgi:hypothetical protein
MVDSTCTDGLLAARRQLAFMVKEAVHHPATTERHLFTIRVDLLAAPVAHDLHRLVQALPDDRRIHGDARRIDVFLLDLLLTAEAHEFAQHRGAHRGNHKPHLRAPVRRQAVWQSNSKPGARPPLRQPYLKAPEDARFVISMSIRLPARNRPGTACICGIPVQLPGRQSGTQSFPARQFGRRGRRVEAATGREMQPDPIGDPGVAQLDDVFLHGKLFGL